MNNTQRPAISIRGGTSVALGWSMGITLEAAQSIIELARAHARRVGVPLNIAVVDDGGLLIAFARMDYSAHDMIDIAQHKAKSSALFDHPSEALWDHNKSGGPAPATERIDGELIAYAGGVPIRDGDGALVGAIGVSGGSPAQDSEVARAAVAGWNDLKTFWRPRHEEQHLD